MRCRRLRLKEASDEAIDRGVDSSFSLWDFVSKNWARDRLKDT